MCCCAEAASNLHSKNRRNNVSLLITLPKKDDGMDMSNKDSLIAQYKKRISILIDCGKTFRDAYFSVLASIPLHYVDALLLTHGHADAMQCVEEVVALHEQTGATVPEKEREQLLPLITHLPTFLTPNTLREVLSVSSGLAAQMAVVHDPQQAAAKEALSMTEGEIALQLHVLPDRTCVRLDPFLRDRLSALDSHGSDFPIYAVPVEHGKNYMSLGFVFGTGVCFVGEDNNDHKNGSCIVYLSDMSAHTDVSVQFLQSLTKIDVLVIDLLAGKGKASPAHYCWDDIFPCIYEMLNETNAPKKNLLCRHVL
ncbi:hypothetical protein AGDE_05169 [Angomonas deanei]|uniref:Metallo-beta-lactamase domain-containing protein n=1 Tax=Angomonas deanei TaxID=59799 RepID=A0A7G2CHB0_9TRYP|nr:hypothetical protein AGDE_05169 [Angomonas deanei]CAD2218437.1 hypothetical protein, conserved [Angomonas deanei]|eukprot:EPY38760.1 hypothetical protein AGDE_05169 [Angomonas deanei]